MSAGTISGLGDSCIGLLSVLGTGIWAAAYDMGGFSWFVVQVVAMEKFFTVGTGAVNTLLAVFLSFEFPAANYAFLPMGAAGSASMFFGLIQAVPFFQKKFPDLMHLVRAA
jgi:hypothetical protein